MVNVIVTKVRQLRFVFRLLRASLSDTPRRGKAKANGSENRGALVTKFKRIIYKNKSLWSL